MKRNDVQRVRVDIAGAVQGVGFRPFVFRLAGELGLTGMVYNTASGVVVEAEGPAEQLAALTERIPVEKPEHSFIQSYQCLFLDPVGFTAFEIQESRGSPSKTTLVLPDIAACPQCLGDISDPANRRFLYPFTNCTHCGPRYSIIESLPYDRVNTSMRIFPMCTDCRREYDDPRDRRFHAQPNACPQCGPHVELWDAQGVRMSARHQAVVEAAGAITEGKIVAVKGIGGFHLFAGARNERSVRLLRERKHREEKPFALMFPSPESVERQCIVSRREKTLLTSGGAPVVLLRKRERAGGSGGVAPSVAPGNPYLGVMLPYSPLHHLLMRELDGPVVATSGNLAEEPICIDEQEAVQRLAGIADAFLVHNRPIVRSIDDSVVTTVRDRPMVLRRARGYAPLPVTLREKGPGVLAVGGHLKNTVALSIGENVFVSQHIGDLQTEQSLAAFRRAVESLKNLYAPSVTYVACDRHPEYLSAKYAQATNLSLIKAQHHHAHVVSCMAENHLEGTVLGIAWDGTGFGADRTVWGGEFLKASLSDFKRAGYFRTFRLPGGDKAVSEPRRTAFALLKEIFRDRLMEYADLPPLRSLRPEETRVLGRMIEKGINSPETSSVGRLFDAAASILGLAQVARFEGQAAMAMEYIARDMETEDRYRYTINNMSAGCYIVDWEMMMRELVKDARSKVAPDKISAKFHNTLVETAVDVAKRVAEPRVVLSGGCFQNRYLTERMIRRLQEEGFKPYWHQLVPPNDGGISLGQAVIGAHRVKEREGNEETDSRRAVAAGL